MINKYHFHPRKLHFIIHLHVWGIKLQCLIMKKGVHVQHSACCMLFENMKVSYKEIQSRRLVEGEAQFL